MIQTDIQSLLEPLILSLGYELWGCEYLAQPNHSLLRLYIDKDGGIDIHDCEVVSRAVSAMLDVEDPIKGNYSLEVSSPGIPRPLFNKKQYERYLNEKISLKLFKPVNGSRKITGDILAVKEHTVILAIAGEEFEVLFSDIVKAYLIGE